MSPGRFTAFAALCGTVILGGSVVAGFARCRSPVVDNITAPIQASRSISASTDAEAVDVPQATTSGHDVIPAIDIAIDELTPSGSHPIPPCEIATEHLAAEDEPDSVENDGRQATNSVETLDDCSKAEICIDQYLWSTYQRAPKVDTIKVPEQIKVTIKKRGKTRVVTKTATKLVEEDFTWKDPKAAQKAGMSLMDYVIGGMDRSFKLRLYGALHALDDAGLSPGITSGFRDDYRQSLATGNKAANDSSYHGGSRRGGYGHGLAVDLVSTTGETRLERFGSSEKLWKWIDVHGKEFGIGRPYLDKDPPHVAPIDGKEYAVHHGEANEKLATLAAGRSHQLAVHSDHKVRKRAGTARLSRDRSI